MTARYRYDAFGIPTLVSGFCGNPFLGAGGEQFDPDTGLYFLRARYYDPRLGRFLSADPLSGNGENDYAYAKSDPVNHTDPTGLYTLTEQTQVAKMAPQVRGLVHHLGEGLHSGLEDGLDIRLAGNETKNRW